MISRTRRVDVGFRAAAAALLLAAACAEGPTTITIPPRTGTISGHVLDTNRNPVPGARITVIPFVPDAVADAEGRFVLSDLTVGVEYRLNVVAPGHTSSFVNVEITPAQTFFSVEFTLLRLVL